jgi:putative addiction module component (TIGR02574 family)
MQHTTIPEPPGFAQLSKAEQVKYLQELWDRIAESPGELPVPESHLELAEERLAEYRRDPGRAGSAYYLIDRLAERAKKPR